MKKRSLPGLLCLLLAAALAFGALFRLDNKYTAALPGGLGYNVLQADAEQVAFLVDGWEFWPGELLSPEELAQRKATLHTYAGEHPHLSELTGSPYGAATYRLLLKDPAPPRSLALYLPELLCAGRVYINGELVGEQGSLSPYRPHVADALYPFRSGETTELVIQCANYTHYYSGLYYPPAVGSPTAIAKMTAARLLVYGLLCFVALGLALSNLALWALGRDRLEKWMGLLSLAFALRVCYPFLRALGVPLIRPLYALEDLCASAVLLFALLLAGELSGVAVRWYHRSLALPATAALCLFSTVFPLFILPYAPLFINTYGLVLFWWKLSAGIYLFFLALSGPQRDTLLGPYLLCAAGLYGLSLTVAALTIDRFEPIRGAWPEEYGGFALVLVFGALMVRRGALLTAENRRLTLHLQEEVDRKTRTLEVLLDQRRELLAGLIHDVKNPLSAVGNYLQLIRRGQAPLDSETAGYLDALVERVDAMEGRFGVLQSFSREERDALTLAPVCLNDLLTRFYETNRPDMELSGLTFRLALPDHPLSVRGNEARLRTALENLCYNALSFTPEDGTVTLSLFQEGDRAVISVADTGPGIPPEDLPHLFQRGFTHRPDGSGEGLGLYIVRTVALEHGGTVEAASPTEGGSIFTLRLPLSPLSPKN